MRAFRKGCKRKALVVRRLSFMDSYLFCGENVNFFRQKDALRVQGIKGAMKRERGLVSDCNSCAGSISCGVDCFGGNSNVAAARCTAPGIPAVIQ